MNSRVKKLSAEARGLPADERATLVEDILESLVPLDREIDRAWSIEADERFAAFERGEIATVSADEVMRRLGSGRSLHQPEHRVLK